jgi:site-specific DNA recombinase
MDLPRLWEKATIEEQRKLLLTMLDAVYVDAMKTRSIVAIKPKPPFKPVFQVAASRNGSDIRILNEPFKDSSLFPVKSGSASVSYPVFHSSVPTSKP